MQTEEEIKGIICEQLGLIEIDEDAVRKEIAIIEIGENGIEIQMKDFRGDRHHGYLISL